MANSSVSVANPWRLFRRGRRVRPRLPGGDPAATSPPCARRRIGHAGSAAHDCREGDDGRGGDLERSICMADRRRGSGQGGRGKDIPKRRRRQQAAAAPLVLTKIDGVSVNLRSRSPPLSALPTALRGRIFAYLSGFAFFGSCSASTTNHPSYLISAQSAATALKSIMPSPGTVKMPASTASRNEVF